MPGSGETVEPQGRGDTRKPDQRTGRVLGVLVTYRRPRQLQRTLDLLARQTRPLDRLVVVDNSPTPGAERAVAAYGESGLIAEYVPSPDNGGPAGGIARGMARALVHAADHDWIVTLDDDDPPQSETVLADLKAFAHDMLSKDPRTGMVGLVGARFDWRRGRLVRLPDRALTGPVSVDYIGGNHFPFIRAEVLREIGPFRSDLFFGLDDLEFGLRMRRKRYSIFADGSGWLRRRADGGRLGLDVRPSTVAGDPGWRRYYSLRNAIWILRSHRRTATATRVTLVHGVAKPVANLVRDPAAAAALLRLNLTACRDAWAGRMGRTIDPDGEGR